MHYGLSMILHLLLTVETQDIWSNLVMDVSVRLVLDENNIWIGRLSKFNCLP